MWAAGDSTRRDAIGGEDQGFRDGRAWWPHQGHTNAIEGFWSHIKRGISGVYHSVSAKYRQMYLDEYTFRYNHRG